MGSCIFNQTQYALCKEKDKVVCCDPKELPYQYWIEIRTNLEEGRLVGKSEVIADLSIPVSILFDACDASDDDPNSNCGHMGWRKYYEQQDKYLCPRPEKGKGDLPRGCHADWTDDPAEKEVITVDILGGHVSAGVHILIIGAGLNNGVEPH